MAKTTPTGETYVLVTVQGSDMMVTQDEGMAAFAALANAIPVRYDWTDKVWKRYDTNSDGVVLLKAMSAAQVAQIALSN